MKTFHSLFSASLDLLFPPSCPYCKKDIRNSTQLLCRECFERLKFIKTPYCSCCGRVFPGNEENHLCGACLKPSWKFDKVRSLFAYEEIIAGLIHNLKYSGKMTGLETFKWLSGQSAVLNDFATPDFIIPVPLHVKRLRKRGFNQALVLARSLFPEEKEKIRYNILVRATDTPSQTGLSGKKRRKNLKNAFIIEKASEITGKNILLLDDVFTTGSTANECAKALKAAGCKKVEVLTICRADKIVS
jgi:ComF family protein